MSWCLPGVRVKDGNRPVRTAGDVAAIELFSQPSSVQPARRCPVLPRAMWALKNPWIPHAVLAGVDPAHAVPERFRGPLFRCDGPVVAGQFGTELRQNTRADTAPMLDLDKADLAQQEIPACGTGVVVDVADLVIATVDTSLVPVTSSFSRS